MKSAEYIVLSAELKYRPQVGGVASEYQPTPYQKIPLDFGLCSYHSAKVLSIQLQNLAL